MYGCHLLPHMDPDTVVPTTETDGEIMAAIENGQVDQFVIANVTTDEAYVTTPVSDAASLPAWR